MANAAAVTARAEVLTVPSRDADVPISALGADQARALGVDMRGWANRPEAVWCSP